MRLNNYEEFLTEARKENVDKLLKQLGYEYSFVFVFAPAVKSLYPILSKLIETWELPTEVTKESIVYLTICLVGILLNEPKAKYKAMLDKVREAKLEHLIEPFKKILSSMKQIFSFISKKTGKIITSFIEMFAYTALFVPFAMIFKEIIDQDVTTFHSVMDAIESNSLGKALSTATGIGVFGVKIFMEDILVGLKSLKDRGVSSVKRVIDKIKSINIKELLNIPQGELELEPAYAEVEDTGPPRAVNYVDSLFDSNNMKYLKSYSNYVLS